MTDWLKIARDAYQSSTNYTDSNYRRAWERNIALFQSRHPSGSKYLSPDYKHRSRLFVPKTRSVVRKNEAAAAAAFFSNVDVVDIEAENDGDQMQVGSAALMKELVNYRLQKTVPWFLTMMGAIQDAQVMGLVASYQYWKYKEERSTSYQPLTDDLGQEVLDADGNVYAMPVEHIEVIEDKPCIELIPLENIRFDPGANWTDVVGSSPYLIRCVPMYLDDVRQMMESQDPKTGQPKWKKYTDEEIKQALVDYDTTRQAREHKREDPQTDNDPALDDFSIVWCHENFIRKGGKEVVYWTLGTLHQLTDPIPLKEAYFHGERPVVIGSVTIETHKPVPAALVEMGSELQKETNDLRNQRMDNVRLVLNKRWLVKRGKQVDIPSLMKNVAGAATMVDDVEADVKELNWPDVTSSAYQEQDRLNVDFDELMGNFSQSSVLTNRKLNETVGGMNLMSGGASALTEYLLRTLVETWVEKVIRQLVKLEQAYETDLTILGLMGERAELQKYGVDQITDELLNQELTVRVNVGMGATDPEKKLQRLIAAVNYAGQAMQTPGLNGPEVAVQIFALAGYSNAERFIGQDPKLQAMQMQMQEMQQALQDMQMQLKDKTGELKVKAFDAETKRLAAVKPEAPQMPEQGPTELDQLNALADIGVKEADRGLKEAQTYKTMIDASIAPQVAKQKQQQANARPAAR